MSSSARNANGFVTLWWTLVWLAVWLLHAALTGSDS